MADYTAYFNGEWVPNSEVMISPVDRGFLVGDVVFDVERTFNGKSFRMKEHIDRLYRSLKYIRVDPGMTKQEMADLTREVAERNETNRAPGDDYMITQIIWRGGKPDTKKAPSANA